MEQAHMPFKSINGIEMHYMHLQATSAISKATPVLLLSGMASDGASWQPILTTLNQQHELIVPDNRCSGRTLPLVVTTNRSLMVSDTLQLMDALLVDKVVIVGHSMGGMLGWALAAEAPDRIKHLVCASALPTALASRVALFESLSRLRSNDNEQHWFEHFYHFLFSHEFFEDKDMVSQTAQMSINYPYKQSAAAFAQQARGLASFQTPVNLDQISCPVTMLTGSNDILMTPAMMHTFCAEHPTISQSVIHGAAHALHWEKSQQVADLILSAIKC